MTTILLLGLLANNFTLKKYLISLYSCKKGIEETPNKTKAKKTRSKINTSLVNAFHRTLGSARQLMNEIDGIAIAQLVYRIGTDNNVQLRDKIEACRTRDTHNKIAPLWNNFADNWKKDYKAYKDKYRKKIFKTYFTAIKRLYGIYASRMKKLMKKVGRDYDCDL